MAQQFIVKGEENVQIIFEDGSLSAELTVDELKSKISPKADIKEGKDSKENSSKAKGK